MKIIYFLPFFLFFLTTQPAFGSEILAKRLSVSFHETPIKQALDEIARMADFEWAYNSKILDAQRRVSLQAQDWTVREILLELLGADYTIKSNGKYLILKKNQALQSEVSGVIRASKSGERLANVTIYDRKTLRATTTDSSGYYQLRVKKSTELVILRSGFKDTILQVASMTPRYKNLELNPVQIPVPDSSTTLQSIQKSFRYAATELDYFFAATLDKWHDLNVPDTLKRRFQLSILPKIGTNHVLSSKVENDWSINLLAGQSAGVRYFEAAGLGNFTKNKVRGAQLAGLFNYNRGVCKGLQAAGLYNRTEDTLEGIQLAGLMNVAGSSPKHAFQAAGLINILQTDSTQNTTQEPPGCIQLAGLVNKAGSLNGVQASGLINRCQNINGLQIGVINSASEVQGFQSGVVNHAKRMRGLQIGLINTADEVTGLQIGLLNRVGKVWLPFFNWRHKKPK